MSHAYEHRYKRSLKNNTHAIKAIERTHAIPQSLMLNVISLIK